jgi:nitrogen fixation protein
MPAVARFHRLAALGYFLIGAVAVLGCASTTVKKDPGPCDRGFRYYRPKPYLFLQPQTGADDMVSISLQYLPDFSEEYSIHIRTGIGKNKTSVKLDNGWNLTQLDVDIDTELPQNIEAVSKLISAIAPKGLVPAPTASPLTAGAVKATNVPMGYYEAVVSKGPDGKKRLYGWRYVGFAPYAQCPITSSGVEVTCCESLPLYGLVFDHGVMTFKPLAQAAVADTRRDPPAAGSPNPALKQVRDVVIAAFKPLMVPLDESKLDVSTSGTTFTVTVKLDANAVAALVKATMTMTAEALKAKLSKDTTAALQKTPDYKAFDIKIEFPQ